MASVHDASKYILEKSRGAGGPGFSAFAGAPGKIRTPDLLIRSQTLYPAELLARSFLYSPESAPLANEGKPARVADLKNFSPDA